MEEQYYDSSSIAARSKREQLMKEAEEYRLHRHIATFQKLEKSEKQPRGESYRKFSFLPGTKPHLTPGQ